MTAKYTQMKLNLSYKVFLWLKLVFTEHIIEQREEQQNFLQNVKSSYNIVTEAPSSKAASLYRFYTLKLVDAWTFNFLLCGILLHFPAVHTICYKGRISIHGMLYKLRYRFFDLQYFCRLRYKIFDNQYFQKLRLHTNSMSASN